MGEYSSDFYICLARNVEYIDQDAADIRSQQKVIICTPEGRTSDDYRGRFWPQNARNEDYCVQPHKTVEGVDRSADLEARISPGGRFFFVDMYARRNQGGERLEMYVLDSIRRISEEDVNAICAKMDMNAAARKRVEEPARKKYRAELEELEARFHGYKRLAEDSFYAAMDKAPTELTLSDAAAEFVK